MTNRLLCVVGIFQIILILQRGSFGERNFSCERMTSHLTGHKLEDFVKLNKLGEGTYGVVFKVRTGNPVRKYDPLFQGQNKKTGEVVAMKKIKLESEDEGVGLMD